MFQCGDRVMYAGHGVCKILDLEIKTVDRKKIEYFVLEPIEQPGTRYFVPTQNKLAVAKMQPILTKTEIDRLLSSVNQVETPWIDDENQRKQRYKELLSGGDRAALICMMRSAYKHKLQQIEAGRKFHLCDEIFLRDSERLLNSEFSFVLGIDDENVGEYIRERLDLQ